MQIQPNIEVNSEDTVFCSDAQHPAATPACQRLMGLWLNAQLQCANPECLCSVRTAGRLRRPGYSRHL